MIDDRTAFCFHALRVETNQLALCRSCDFLCLNNFSRFALQFGRTRHGYTSRMEADDCLGRSCGLGKFTNLEFSRSETGRTMTKWKSTQWNHGVSVNNNKTGGFAVALKPGANLNSVQADNPGLKLGQTISIDYKIKTLTGKPKFSSLDKGAPANFSVMIAHGELEGRWYMSGVAYALLQKALDRGKQTWSIKLKPQFWQDVNGKQNGSQFKKALSDARIIQVVFGGKFRAHGVEVAGGNARVAILSFSVR